MPTKETITHYFKQLQDAICQQLEQADGKGTLKKTFGFEKEAEEEDRE